jgi:Do/DeqQ family serine protease
VAAQPRGGGRRPRRAKPRALPPAPPTGRGGRGGCAGTLALCGLLAIAPASPALALVEEELRRDAVVRAVEKARPTVVNVNTEEEVAVSPFGASGDPIFERFFRDFFETAPRRRVTSRSLGSGVIVDPRGYILTNEHVVARASRVSVTLADERTYPAKIVGTDPDHDLAVIRVEAKEPLPAIETGDSDHLLIGERVIAIGNPFGLTHSVTTGVVSATRRSIRTAQGRSYYDFVQTDAAINPGNSGGPLLDINGRMIGVNTAVYSEGMGIGFAIPAAVARRVVEDLVRYGQVQEVWAGIAVGDAPERDLGAGERPHGGLPVLRVAAGGAAARAGIEVGDVILAVGGTAVRSAGEFHYHIGRHAAGETVSLTLRRGKDSLELPLRTEKFTTKVAGEIAWEWLGLSVRFSRVGVAVSRIRSGGAAAAIGLEPGDLILQVGGEELSAEEGFARGVMLAFQRGALPLLVQRGRRGYFITLPVKGLKT